MAAFAAIAVFFGIFFIAAIAQRGAMRLASGRNRSGVAARGLVLQAAPFSTERTVGGVRYEVRLLVLDVEVPGATPYEVTVSPLIPRICEAVPGATFDLRVSPRNPQDITVVGPAGASGWIDAAPWLTTGVTPFAGTGVNVPRRFALRFTLAIFFAFTTYGFVGGIEQDNERSQARAAPVSHVQCQAAIRCCAVIGTNCDALIMAPEDQCVTALQVERNTAAKLHKRCP